jgi:hypothetical protein
MQINWEYKCFAISLEKYAEHGCQKDKLFFSNFLKISGSGVWEIPAGGCTADFPYICGQDAEFAFGGKWS